MSSPVAFREPVLLRLGRHNRITLLHLDYVLITFWFAATAAKFPYDEFFLYPMAGYFAYAFVRDRHLTWPILQRGFLLMLLPIWWLASTLWSPEPMLAFRSGMQVILTILICMFIASRLDTKAFMIVLMFSMITITVLSVPYGLRDWSLNAPSLGGRFPHKNSFGTAMAVVAVVSLAIVLSRDISKFVRLIALGLLPAALFLVLASKSATAILITAGMAGGIIGALLYLGSRNRMTVGRIALIAATVAAIAIVLAVVINRGELDLIGLVLDAVGKDRTLTGRTDLWSIGIEEIGTRPYLGVGAHGYWRYDYSPIVRQIFEDYYKDYNNTFYFHNSWLELAVSLGIPGVLMAGLAMLWALVMLARRAFREGGPRNWAFLAIGFAIVVRTMTESDLFTQFVMLHMAFWSSALMAAAPQARKVAPQATWAPALGGSAPAISPNARRSSSF